MKPRLTGALAFGVMASLLGAFPLRAQDPGVADPWRVPIHTLSADPVGGAYGLWAAGPTYKATFDDGVTYFPVLGSDYPRNLPLRWRTESIELGAAVLVDGTRPGVRHHSDWRYELRYGDVTEAYDVREDGLEQTFVLEHRPTASGDLVVRGRITTSLVGDRVAADHQALEFRGPRGEPVVSFGAAFGVDGLGDRVDVTTRFDGDLVEMRLPGDWLANAAYPVVLDPVISTSVIPSGAAGNLSAQAPSIIRDDVNNQILLTYSRNVAGGDFDGVARVLDDDMQPVAVVFADLAAIWSTRYLAPSYVRGPDRWAVAVGRDFPVSVVSEVRCYVHDATNLVTNSGTVMFLASPAGFSEQKPVIGGSQGQTGEAYIAYQRDAGGVSANSANSQVMGISVDAAALTFGVPTDLHTQIGSFDDELPMITTSAGTQGWVVVWMGLNYANASDDWDILGQRVATDGTLLGFGVFGNSGTASRHKIHPAVDGRDGRYLVSYFLRDNTGPISTAVISANELAVQRFDWSGAATAPTKAAPQTVVFSGPVNDYGANQQNRCVSYDTDTDSHWAVVYRDIAIPSNLYAARCGHEGRVVEMATVYSDPVFTGYSPTVCYNDDVHEFEVGYLVADPPPAGSNPIYGSAFQYLPAANVGYGRRCPATLSGNNRGFYDEPFAGSEFFSVTVTADPSLPVFVLVGAGPADVPIPGSACSLRLDPKFPILTVAAGSTNIFGSFAFTFPLADSVTVADLYWQAMLIDGGALESTNGLITQIR